MEFVQFQLTHAEKKREFLAKVQKEIMKRIGQALINEVEIIEIENRRFIQESGIAKVKLNDKISAENAQFLGTASFN